MTIYASIFQDYILGQFSKSIESCPRLGKLTASSARRLAALPSLRELRLGSWAAIEERAFKERIHKSTLSEIKSVLGWISQNSTSFSAEYWTSLPNSDIKDRISPKST